MTTPRRLRAADLPEVEALYAACHPRWPARASGWYEAVNTLVLVAHGHLLGMTSGSVTVPPTPELAKLPHGADWVMFGHDVCVHPDVQGQGYGLILATARMTLARRAGCHTFLGVTWESNHAMRRIFDRLGCKQYGPPTPGLYPHHDPPDDAGLIYLGRL